MILAILHRSEICKDPKLLLTAIFVWLFIINSSTSSILLAIAQLTQKGDFGNFLPKTHEIEVGIEELPQGQIAYKMIKYIQRDNNNQTVDVTSRYNNHPTIPGPNIVVTEGDRVKITLVNEMGWGSPSIHTHGVHYKITSDGTAKAINGVANESSSPNSSFTYEWEAGEDTAGSWPFHDHTLAKNSFGMNMNGLETVGLFASIIVNPSDGKVNALVNDVSSQINVKDIDKDFVLFISDETFWGTEIDHSNGEKHTPLWVNPTLVAANNETVRFDIHSLGNEFHNFTMDSVKWLRPGTNETINSQIIAPLANLVFTVNANKNATYSDNTELNPLRGMKGEFIVDSDGGASIPGKSPL
jgi:manganese oxidase